MNTERIEQLARRIQIEPGVIDGERILADAANTLERIGAARTAAGMSLWRTIMNSKTTKFAAAAVIVIAAIIVMRRYDKPIDGAGTAWSDVIEQVRKARTVVYKQTLDTGDDVSATERMINVTGVLRWTLADCNGNPCHVSILDYSSGTHLQLSLEQKKAFVSHFVGRPREGGLFNYLDFLTNIHTKACRFVGQEMVDGKMTDVFSDENTAKLDTTTVWVDPETNLPVRVKQVRIPDADPRTGTPHIALSNDEFGAATASKLVSMGGVPQKWTTVMRDFVWDADLDEELFDLTPPKGFAVEEEQIDAAEPTENHLLQALAFWAEMSDGLFPSFINALANANSVKAMLIEKFNKDGDPDEEMRSAAKMAEVTIKGLEFVHRQARNSSWYYAGDGVKVGDSDKPICWWNKEGSDKYRVIYGNLSIGDVEADALPQQ